MKNVRSHTARLFALAVIAILYGLSQLPQLPASERARLAATFDFTGTPLPEPAGFEYRTIRSVQPGLAHIAAWISAFGGAAIALNDLDGDGLANDLCHIDSRIDQIIISPAPGTLPRYESFVLDQSQLRYDPARMAPAGCLPNDMNEDGRLDLLVYYWGRTPVAFLNQTTPTLSAASYMPVEIMPGQAVWWSSGGTFADFDGDGHVDLLVTNYFPDDTVLLGDQPGQLPQLNHSLSRAANGGGTHLFLWAGATAGTSPTVSFQKVDGILASEVSHGWSLAVGAADLDGDLLPEIYLSNDYGPDRLLHNRSAPGRLNFALLEGEKFFNTPNSKIVGRDSFKGMGVDFGDLNGDGLFDIYVSNIAADYAFHESHFLFLSTGETERMRNGIAPYVDYSEPLGLARGSWSWEARLADFNNDGSLEAVQATGFLKGLVNRWPELQELGLGNDELSANPNNWPQVLPGDNFNGHEHNRFFVRSESGRFFDLAPDLGLDQLQVSRGIATADVDGDGDLDFAVANQWITAEAVAAGSGYTEARYDPAGRRWEPHLQHLPLAETKGEIPLGPDDVLLVTGGGKGITAECALTLARETGVRLALLGRSQPATDPELADNLARLAAAEVEFRYLAADVTDLAAVQTAVREIESVFGPVTAILHGAARNVPQSIRNLDEESFRRTLAPKIQGARNLLAAIQPDQLRLFVSFGSIIARIGLPGEADYGLANEWLADLTARLHQDQPGCRCLTIDWSVWGGSGMGERLGILDSLIRQGITPIPLEAGVKMLSRLLGQTLPPAVVVTGRFGTPATVRLRTAGAAVLALSGRGKGLLPRRRVGGRGHPVRRDRPLPGRSRFPG